MPLVNSDQTLRLSPTRLGHLSTPDLEPELSDLEVVRQQDNGSLREHAPQRSPAEKGHSLAPEVAGCQLEASGSKPVQNTGEILRQEVDSTPGPLTPETAAPVQLEDLLQQQCDGALTTLIAILERRIKNLSITPSSTETVVAHTSRRQSARSHVKVQKSKSTQELPRSTILEQQRSDVQYILQHLRTSSYCKSLMPWVFLDPNVRESLLQVITAQSCHSRDRRKRSDELHVERAHRAERIVSLCTLILCYNHYILATTKEATFDLAKAIKHTRDLLASMKVVYEQAVDDEEYSASADPQGSLYVLSLLCYLCAGSGGPAEPRWSISAILGVELHFLADLSRLQCLTPEQATRMKNCIPSVESTDIEHYDGHRWALFSLFACGIPVFEQEVLAPLLVDRKFAHCLDEAKRGLPLKSAEKNPKLDSGSSKKNPWTCFPSSHISPRTIQSALQTPQGIEQNFFSDSSNAAQKDLDPAARIASLPYWLGELRRCTYLLSQAYTFVCQSSHACDDTLQIMLDNIDNLIQREAFTSFVLGYLTVKTLLPISRKLPTMASRVYIELWLEKMFDTVLYHFGCTHNLNGVDTKLPLGDVLGFIQTVYTNFLQHSDDRSKLTDGALWYACFQTFSLEVQKKCRALPTEKKQGIRGIFPGGERLSTHNWSALERFASNMIYLLAIRSPSDHCIKITSFDGGNSEKQSWLPRLQKYLRSTDGRPRVDLSASPDSPPDSPPAEEQEDGFFEQRRKAAEDLKNQHTRLVSAIDALTLSNKEAPKRGDAYKGPVLQHWKEEIYKLYTQVEGIKNQLRTTPETSVLSYFFRKNREGLNCTISSAGQSTEKAAWLAYLIHDSQSVATWFAEEDEEEMHRIWDKNLFLVSQDSICEKISFSLRMTKNSIWQRLECYVKTIDLLNDIGPEYELQKKIAAIEASIQEKSHNRVVDLQKALNEQNLWIQTAQEQLLPELSAKQQTLQKSVQKLETQCKNYSESLKTACKSTSDHHADLEIQGSPEDTHMVAGDTLNKLEKELTRLFQTHKSVLADTKSYFSQARELDDCLSGFLEKIRGLIKILEPSTQKMGNTKHSLLDQIPEITKTKLCEFSRPQSPEEIPNNRALVSAQTWQDSSDQCDTHKANAYRLQKELENKRRTLIAFEEELRNMQLARQSDMARADLEGEILKCAYNLRNMMAVYRPVYLEQNDPTELVQGLLLELSTAALAFDEKTKTRDFSLLRVQQHTLEGLWKQYQLRFSHTEGSAPTPELNPVDQVCSTLTKELNEHRQKIEHLSNLLSSQISAKVSNLAAQIQALFSAMVQESLPLETLQKLEGSFSNIKTSYEELNTRIVCYEQLGIPLSHDVPALDSLSRDMITAQQWVHCLVDIAQRKIKQQKRSASPRIPSRKTKKTSQDSSKETMSVPELYIETPHSPPETDPEVSLETACPIKALLDQLQYQTVEERNLLQLQISLGSLVDDITRHSKDHDVIRKITATIQQHYTALEETKKLILASLNQLFRAIFTTLQENRMSNPIPNLQTALSWFEGPGDDLEVILHPDPKGNISLIQINLADEHATGVMLDIPQPEDLPEAVKLALEFLSRRFQLDPKQRISDIVIRQLQTQLSSLRDLINVRETSRYPNEYNQALSDLFKIACEASQQMDPALANLLETRKSGQAIDIQTRSLLDLSGRMFKKLQDRIALFDFEFSYIDQQDRHTHLHRLNIQGTLDMLSRMLRVLESYVPVTYASYPSYVTPCTAPATATSSMPNYAPIPLSIPVPAHFGYGPGFWPHPTQATIPPVYSEIAPAYLAPHPF